MLPETIFFINTGLLSVQILTKIFFMLALVISLSFFLGEKQGLLADERCNKVNFFLVSIWEIKKELLYGNIYIYIYTHTLCWVVW